MRIYEWLSGPLTPEAVASAIATGMLPKSDLRHGVIYSGFCRNSLCALWDAKRDRSL